MLLGVMNMGEKCWSVTFIIYSICSLFNDTVSNSELRGSNNWMTRRPDNKLGLIRKEVVKAFHSKYLEWLKQTAKNIF